MTCLTNQTKPKADHLVNSFSNVIQFISRNVSNDDKFVWSCCSTHYTLVKMESMIRSTCPRVNQDAEDYIKLTVTTLFSDIMDLACGRYSNYDNCMKRVPENMRIVDQVFNSQEQKSHSLLRPLIQIALSLDQE